MTEETATVNRNWVSVAASQNLTTSLSGRRKLAMALKTPVNECYGDLTTANGTVGGVGWP